MFAQLVGLFGTALFFASYQCRDNRQLFRVQFLSYLCYTAHLFLLGAATGAVSYLINTFRSFCLSSRYDFLRSRAMGAVICVFQILALVFTWSGWLSVLPVAANIATTIGGYTYNAVPSDRCSHVHQLAALDRIRHHRRLVGRHSGRDRDRSLHPPLDFPLRLEKPRRAEQQCRSQSSGAGMTAACSACPRRKQVSYGLQPEIR